jgi:hypothetical protein
VPAGIQIAAVSGMIHDPASVVTASAPRPAYTSWVVVVAVGVDGSAGLES